MRMEQEIRAKSHNSRQRRLPEKTPARLHARVEKSQNNQRRKNGGGFGFHCQEGGQESRKNSPAGRQPQSQRKQKKTEEFVSALFRHREDRLGESGEHEEQRRQAWTQLPLAQCRPPEPERGDGEDR